MLVQAFCGTSIQWKSMGSNVVLQNIYCWVPLKRVNNDTTLILGWTIPLRHSRAVLYGDISYSTDPQPETSTFLHPQNYRGAVPCLVEQTCIFEGFYRPDRCCSNHVSLLFDYVSEFFRQFPQWGLLSNECLEKTSISILHLKAQKALRAIN